MAGGSVTFSTKLDNKTLEQELSRLGKKILRLEDNLNTRKLKRNALAESLKQARQELAKLQGQTTLIDGKFQVSPEAVARITELQEKIPQMEADIKKYDDAMKDVNQTLEATAQRYGDINTELQRRNTLQEPPGDGGGSDAGAAQQLSKMEQARAVVRETIQAVKKGLVGLGSLAAGTVSSAIQRVPGLVRSAFSMGLSLTKTLGNRILNMAKRLNVFAKVSKSLGGIFSRLGGMVRRVFVFSVLTSGLRLIRTQLTKYLSLNTELMNALGRLKGVLLTAFQPIYDVAVPALTTLLNVMTRVMAVMAQFIATLFGTTAKKAQANAKALNQEANALESVGTAAEEAAGSLAGFDEINTIQTESKGGGAGSENSAPIFDYEYEEAPFDSWGEALSAFLDKILGSIPKMKDAFRGFADWLNGLSFNLLEMFHFNGVKEKVEAIGRELANALNQLVLDINWYQLGQALGAGLNLALLFLVNFLYTFDWLALGSALADGLNGLVSEIDWYAFGQLLWAGFKIGIETLAGFLLGLDMKQLAEAATRLVIGFCNSMTETLAAIDWEEIGHQVAVFLANVNWAEVAESTFTAIGAAFGAAAAFLWGLIKDAWSSVVNWWYDTAYEDGQFTLEGLLQGILDVVTGIGTWIYDHIFKPFIDGFCDVFGIHSPSTVMAELGRFIMDGLLGGTKEKLQPFLNFFDDMKKNIQTVLNGIIQFITGVFTGDWGRAWDGVKNIFKGIWNGIVSVLEGAVNLIIDGINWMISQLNKISFDVPSWVHAIGGSRFGFNIPSVGRISIPRLAEGAVIPPNREFLAVLGDQKSGTNVEAPLNTIERALENVLSRNGGTGGGDIHITVELDGRVVARQTVKHINDMTRQAGKPVLLL